MKNCPKCKKDIQEDHLFCYHCGADLRIPLCRFCSKELPENAAFCPWCGKPQAESVAPENAETCQAASSSANSEPCFTQDQLNKLTALLDELYPKLRFIFSEKKIHWCKRESIWGALDGCGTDTIMISIVPINLACFDLQDLRPGFCLNNLGCKELFSRLAESAQTKPEPGVWSVSRPYDLRRNHYDVLEHVHNSYSLAVRNPMGIGVDLLVTYEHYDDMG